MGIDYLVCDHCGEGFPDVMDYYYCDKCGKIFCRYCAEEAGLEFDEDDNVISCEYCRKEAFTDYDKLQFLMKKYNLTDEQLEAEMKKEDK